MRKNLLQPEVRKEIADRIRLLRPNIQRQWGKMNVNQMLLHNYNGMHIAYGDFKVTPNPTSWFQKKFLRYFILHTDFPTPKEKAETFPEMNMVQLGINPGNFTELQKQLAEAVENFPVKQTLAIHPFLGKFSEENWARLNYTHLHHHLSQFGV
jgi:hypothetical protein